MELRRQLSFLRASLPLVIATTVLGALFALVVSQFLPPTFEARVIVQVGQATEGNSDDLNSLQVSQRLSQTYAALAVTNSAATDVIESLDLDTVPEDLLEHVRAEAPLDSTLLTITVDDPDAAQAAAIANAFAERMVLLDVSDQGQAYEEMLGFVEADLRAIRTQIATTEARIADLQDLEEPTAAQLGELTARESQVATLRSTFATLLQLSTTGRSAGQLAVADPATIPPAPISPRVALNVLLGAALGLVIGVVLAYTRRRLDDTVRTPEELELEIGTPVLGTIVQMPGEAKRGLTYRLATVLYPRSPAAEGFRHIRTGTEFASLDNGLRTLLVTSAMPGDGKTTIAANLAVAFAQAGRTVCLVDADLRKPEVHNLFRVANDAGLADMLAGGETTFQAATHPTEVEGLRVLTSGPVPANPAELVASPRMRSILAGLAKEVDLVVLDSPPLQAVTDAAILASISDGTILVVAAGKTRRALAVRAVETLSRVGARTLGTVLNGVNARDGEDAAFGYFNYYGKPEPSDGGTPPTPPRLKVDGADLGETRS